MASRHIGDAKATPGIVPHTKIKGVDIAGYRNLDEADVDGFQYHCLIFRSDLGPGFYMDANIDDEEAKPVVKPMVPLMKDADHYFCTWDTTEPSSRWLYMIKGDSVAKMQLETHSLCAKFQLHPNCRGGDHYICYVDFIKEGREFNPVPHFVIIFQSRGVFRIVHDLETDKGAKEHPLADKCKNGIYYWGHSSAGYPTFYFINQVDPEWKQAPMHIIKDLKTGEDKYPGDVDFFPANWINFLPGGTSTSIGPCTGSWSLVKSIDNKDCDTSITWDKKVSMTVGHNKSVAKTIGSNWDVSATAGVSVEAYAIKASISLSAKYGGSQSSTEGEDWKESHTVEESLKMTVEPHKMMYLWQFSCKMGDKEALFCKYLKSTQDKTPPTNNPLPLSQGP